MQKPFFWISKRGGGGGELNVQIHVSIFKKKLKKKGGNQRIMKQTIETEAPSENE